MYNEQELYTYIGKQIFQARRTTFQHRVITQTELAKAACCTFQQIQKYEKATNRVSIRKLSHIAKYTNKPLSFFIPKSVWDSTTISS